MLLPISHALFKAGLNRDEILTLLTDTNYFMGRAAYDHAQTKSRMKAAEWLWKYTVKKVFDERDLDKKFAEPVAPSKELSFDEMSEQEKSFDELRDWKDDLDISEKGVYRATLKNTVDILKHEAGENCVKRNIFAYRDAYNIDTPWGGKNGAAITDDDTVKIKNWFGRNWGFEPNTNLVGEALSIIATDNAFDPVIDWLEALPPWDEVARLDTWLEKHFEAKIKKENAEACREYLAQVFRKWVFGMVLRAYKPGAKFDWMPIFEGPQGIGKSSFGRILVGEDLFLDWLPDLHDKDAALGLQGCWAVEMGELASMRKNEIEIVKAFVSRQVDKVRPPYGQRRIESPRRCVFFGTTNNATYLKDESGNRRFKPLEVGLLDFDKLSEDREQLFAEALWLFRSGFESEKTTELSGFARDFERIIQAEKMVQDEADLMAEKIDEFLQKETPNFDRLCFKIGDLFILNNVPGPIHFWRFDARNVQFAGKAVKKLGGSKYHTKIGSRWKMGRNV
jgi:predicted P-loop ATPase